MADADNDQPDVFEEAEKSVKWDEPAKQVAEFLNISSDDAKNTYGPLIFLMRRRRTGKGEEPRRG
ncbi:MAG: hypothetical protein R3C05_08660 [Pirellulaceae bacterium]